MAWKKGPLPSGTYNWGAAVPVTEVLAAKGLYGGGFYFADFHGDKVLLLLNNSEGTVVELLAHEVACYDNGIELPPKDCGVTSRAGTSK